MTSRARRRHQADILAVLLFQPQDKLAGIRGDDDDSDVRTLRGGQGSGEHVRLSSPRIRLMFRRAL